MPVLDKKTLEYLAELGRIELTESEKPKLSKDLQEILNYFQELQKLDTTAQAVGGQVSGGTFREDKKEEKRESEKLIDSFPEKENNFLKIPPVFSAPEGRDLASGEE